jgi:transposase-like protein
MSVRTVTVSVMWLAVAASLVADRDQMVLAQARGLGDATIASGLKEALQVGTQNAVSLTGRPDGYFQNAAIKILMPSQLQPIEKGLRAVGYGPQVDELVLSMNRAAERAAPAAKPIFLEAITAMSFDDARKIMTGSPTAATEYFKGVVFQICTLPSYVSYCCPLVKEGMMVLIPVHCPHCQSEQVIKGGKTQVGTQRYKCQNVDCPHYSFQLDLTYKGRSPAIKERIIDMALNGSGIRDTARVLQISPTTVINELKKKRRPSAV